MSHKFKITGVLLLLSFFGWAQNPIKIINDVDLGAFTTTWTSDTTYLLNGYVFLEVGGLLTIESGTVIKARQIPDNGDPTSALIICKGAEISAVGTYMNPIIFTAEQDDVKTTDDLLSSDRGRWGGLVLLGDAPVINKLGEQIESSHPMLPMEDIRSQFGGDDPMHSSGALRNVSIRFAGALVNVSSFSGLSLAGQGQGTKIDSVEVFASGGDGFEFVGGSVDSRNLSSAFCADDCFDWDLGFTGRGQFWFGLQGADIADCGMEGRGQFSNPILYNNTLIGTGQNSEVNNQTAIRLLEGSGAAIGMSIFTDFPNKGLEIEDLPGNDDSYAKLGSGQISFISNIWSDFGSGLDFSADGLILVSPEADDSAAIELSNHLLDSNFAEINWIKYVSREQSRLLYPDEKPFFRDYPLSYPADTSFFTEGSYLPCIGHGAFITDGAWWLRYWTALDGDGYLMHPCAYSFYDDARLNFAGGDTIIITCEAAELLDFDYICRNSYCTLGTQNLSLAMRRKRKKKSSLQFDQERFCYLQELEFSGEELIFDQETSEFLVLDEFTSKFTAMIIDTIAPEFSLQSCDTCSNQIYVSSSDCDTSWISGYDTLIVNDSITQHTWTAIDRCLNESMLVLFWNSRAVPVIWYEDHDGDGFGNESSWISWQGSLPGYVLISGDCDDQDALVNPSAVADPNDNLDNNCQGFGAIETCQLGDRLVVSTECNPVTYTLNPSSMESSSSIGCGQSLSPRWYGDIWFSCRAPSSGKLDVQFAADFFIVKLSVYRGACNDLKLVTCSDENKIEASDLEPGEMLFIQLFVDNLTSGSFSVCATTRETTSTVQPNQTSKILVYPNPSSGKYKIVSKDFPPTTGLLRVHSLIGQQMKTFDFKADPSQGLEVDISDLPSGSYWLILENALGRWTNKIIKM